MLRRPDEDAEEKPSQADAAVSPTHHETMMSIHAQSLCENAKLVLRERLQDINQVPNHQTRAAPNVFGIIGSTT